MSGADLGRTWRDWLLIHPAAELLPPMPLVELHALADAIKQNGGAVPRITLLRNEHGEESLLHGADLLDAVESMGEAVTRDLPIFRVVHVADPFGFIRIMLQRQHLDSEQRREVLAKLAVAAGNRHPVKPAERAAAAIERAMEAIRADPTRSNRAVAAAIHVAEWTVRRARREIAGTADPAAVADAAVETRVGRDGKRRRLPRAHGGAP